MRAAIYCFHSGVPRLIAHKMVVEISSKIAKIIILEYNSEGKHSTPSKVPHGGC